MGRAEGELGLVGGRASPAGARGPRSVVLARRADLSRRFGWRPPSPALTRRAARSRARGRARRGPPSAPGFARALRRPSRRGAAGPVLAGDAPQVLPTPTPPPPAAARARRARSPAARGGTGTEPHQNAPAARLEHAPSHGTLLLLPPPPRTGQHRERTLTCGRALVSWCRLPVKVFGFFAGVYNVMRFDGCFAPARARRARVDSAAAVGNRSARISNARESSHARSGAL